MFHSYYFIRKLSKALGQKLTGWEFVACFSQNKDEIVFGLAHDQEECYIKCNFDPQVSLIDFPSDFKRARKNSIDLFPEILGKKIETVHQVDWDRSFYFQLSDGAQLLFKLHGRRSNVLLFKDKEESKVFRHVLASDQQTDLNSLARTISIDHPQAEDLRQLRMLLGKTISASATDDEVLKMSLNLLVANKIYLHKNQQGKPEVSLLEPTQFDFESDDPIKICQELHLSFVRDYLFLHKKQSIVNLLKKRQSKTEKALESYQLHLKKINTRRSYEEVANIVMANLHQFKPGQEKIVLEDFYTNRPIEIKIKRGVKPQHHAENLYRKGKNEKIERQKTEESIAAKEEELFALMAQLEDLEPVDNFRTLNQFVKEKKLDPSKGATSETILPYKEVIYMGFQIWIGKHSKANDELTLKYARKDDTWLHAKDVSGSHVVIKNAGNKTIPTPVLEKAAALAAHHSKRKSDSLCPVIYTPKKFVRKRKGDPPGAVVVEREQVIMIAPSPEI
ncbi:MAG: NFACT RNA binding domain-containing protein [Cytophagales bacterium]|nr:NFACT RNA binding domain-containing protein [Cytophagales bacterium]